jgi:amino acid transporter
MMSYVCYRLGLPKNGHAPKVFTRLTRYKVPYVEVIIFILFMKLEFLTVFNGASTVFI